MIELEALEVSHWISRYLYPFARFSGLFMVMPLIGTRMVPAPIRIILAFAVTIAIVPILPPFPHYDALSLNSFLVILQQLLIGIALGFVIELVTQVFRSEERRVGKECRSGLLACFDHKENEVCMVRVGFVV